MMKEISKRLTSELFVGVKLNADGTITKIKTADVVLLNASEIALGNFDEAGQIALYADRNEKIHEAVIYGHYVEELLLDEVTPRRLIAFTNDKTTDDVKKAVLAHFDDVAHAKQNEAKVRDLIAQIRINQREADLHREEIGKNFNNKF